MQISIELPDRLIRKFYKNHKPIQLNKIVTRAIEEEIENKQDSLWDITKFSARVKKNDISENHDKYLMEDLIKRKTGLRK